MQLATLTCSGAQLFVASSSLLPAGTLLVTDEDFQELGHRTEGFSGSDVSVLVKDVLMQPIRLLREATHFKQVPGARRTHMGCV